MSLPVYTWKWAERRFELETIQPVTASVFASTLRGNGLEIAWVGQREIHVRMPDGTERIIFGSDSE
jgi:hypothetical protein